MTAPAEIGFAVIGCGGIGRWHARSIRSLPGAHLAAAADPDEAARRRAAKDFAVPVFEHAEEALVRPDVEVVSICTPPAIHARLTEAAARCGKHVLVEKPMAVTLAEADRMVAACAAAGVRLGVMHQLRAMSASQAVHRLVASSRLGQPLVAIGSHGWFRRQSDLDGHAWRSSASGAALLLDQAIHLVDLLIWLLGAPTWVAGRSASLALRGAGEDTAVATMGFPSGALATIGASTAANLMRDDVALEIMGTRGGVRLEIRDYDNAEITWLDLAAAEGKRASRVARADIEALIQQHGGEWRQGPRALLWRTLSGLVGEERGIRPFRSPLAYLRRRADRIAQAERGQPQGHAAVLAEMAAAVRTGRSPMISGEDGRTAIAVIDALARSHAGDGQPVQLDPRRERKRAGGIDGDLVASDSSLV